MCEKWMGAARGVNAGWGGEALFLETETHLSHSDKWGGGRWEVAEGEATVLFALGFEGPRAL